MHHTSTVVFLAIDALILPRGKVLPGFDEFCAALDHAHLPCVWITNRSRLQIDEARRRAGHAHPFIAEAGCGVYLPEDYFHLRPAKTVRLGRFTCIPVAQPLPAASEALESLAEDTGVEVVPLRSLSPRELVQNSGLPQRDAELARQRDFDELFFFAGSTDKDIAQFTAEATLRKLQLQSQGVLWSLAAGSSLSQCVRSLSKLYDRALRSHATIIGIAPSEQADSLFPSCDRRILLTSKNHSRMQTSDSAGARTTEFPLHSPELWEQLFEHLRSQR